MFRYVFFIFLSLIITVTARAPKEYSLQRTEVVMQTEGIKFKPFRDMSADAVQPLRGRFYSRKSSGTVEKVQVYHKNELWRLDNFVSTYKNNLITLQIYKVNYLIPSGMKTYGKSYVEKADFQKFIKPITPENEKDIIAWLRFTTGKKCQIGDKDLKLNYGFQTKAVVSEAKNGVYQFLAISKDKRVYFIYLEMSGAETKDSERAVKEFMRYMKIEPPKQVKASKFQSSKYKPSGKVSTEYQDTIEEVKKQVLNTKGWWLAQTNNYVLKSNLPTKKRSFARKVQEHVEFIRAVYEKFIPPIDEIKAVSIVTIPSTKAEYLSYTGAPEWSGGCLDVFT